MRKIILAATAALALAGGASAAQAGTVQIGMLVCGVGQGTGFIFGSTKRVNCNFVPAFSGTPSEFLFGRDYPLRRRPRPHEPRCVEMGRSGDKLQILQSRRARRKLWWHRGEATTALGVGANILVRGSLLDYMLQPLSVQGQTGLNVALGVTGLTLASR